MSLLTQDDLTAWMDQAGKHRILAPSEIDEIARAIQKPGISKIARARLVNKLTVHNLRLVVSFVNGFMRAKSQRRWGGPETLDYLQQGTLGLRRAAEMYDPTRGYRFSTYATPWIRSFVSRYSMKMSSSWHIPENALREAWQYQNNGFVKTKNGRGIKNSEACLELTNRVRMAQSSISLDAQVAGSGNDMKIIDAIEGSYQEEMIDGGFSVEFEDIITGAGLDEMQVEILRASFVNNLSIDQITNVYGIPKTRVIRLRKNALNTLRETMVDIM